MLINLHNRIKQIPALVAGYLKSRVSLTTPVSRIQAQNSRKGFILRE